MQQVIRKLLVNELHKLYTRIGTKIMVVLVPMMTIAAGLLCFYSSEHDIQVKDAWEFLDLVLTAIPNLMDIVTLCTIIVGAGIVASEFSGGTIKLLLIRPYSRSQILLAKYAAMLLFGLSLAGVMLVAALITGGLLFGFGAGDAAGDVLGNLFKAAVYGGIELVVMATFAFMISSVLRSSAVAIGVSIFFLLSGPQLAYMLKSFGWTQYLLFANLDLYSYTAGRPFLSDMTLTFSLLILAVYTAVFAVFAWVVFAKRDVAN
ncbi:ABC transporter permease [Paenibacillus sp. CF384]|uniref:ABC transporter permease n=1 Tax=Paenibacillus sp. CF384 TaxID=1884382 RepID=UPI000899E61D|nr:DUF2705 family protein [Paenibacillus sp. CF384]SDW19960.1 ABC-2 type transport system permease protein [Paenibacillus sp. CF384]